MELPDLRILVFRPPTPAPHANDGERMEARFRYADEPALHQIMERLGITLRELNASEGERPYRTVEDPWPVFDFPHLANPGHVNVGGVAVFVATGHRFVTLTLHGGDDPYVLGREDAERAQRLDDFLVARGLEAFAIPVP